MRKNLAKRSFFKRALLALALIASIGFIPARSRAAGLLVADGGLGGALDIKEHAVKVTVNNGIAVTQVTQVFVNTENRQVEALYTFPVPRGGSVANFSMWINGKEMTGEVVEKQRAREIYNSYKQQRRDPGLLEQTDYRTFEMRVFPIGPRAEQKVQVTYYQELDYDHDWATYVYPLATRTRNDINARTTGKFALSMDVKSEVPIVEIESPSHPKKFALARHSENYQQASLETREGDLSRDVVLACHIARPRTGIDVLTSRSGSEDGYVCLTLTAGEEAKAADSAMDYVFVLDISGSMNDDGKLDASRRSIAAFVNALGAEDRFDIVAFNVGPTPLFQKLTAADAGAKAKASDFLNAQQARGGTVLQPALTAAYRYASNDRPLNVVVLSDGMTEQNERAQLVNSIRQRPGNSKVFAIGVGNDVNRALLEQIAQDSGGMAAFISRGDDFARQAEAFRRKLVQPVATDLTIKFDGGEVYDVEPKQLPSLYYGAPVRLYARYKTSGHATATLSGKVGGQELTRALELDLPKTDDSSPEIERMWAWKRIDRLMKEADADGNRSGVIPEIVRLGEGYSIASEYTSFIVLENDGEYQRWKIDRKNALRMVRDQRAQDATAKSLEKLREKAATALGPMEEAKPAAPQFALAPTQQSPSAGIPSVSSAPTPRRSFDFSIGGGRSGGGGGGGGAIDPISGVALIALAGAALGAKRKRKEESR